MLTSRLGHYTSRYDDFSANDNNDNNNDNDDTTDYFTSCACAQGKKLVSSARRVGSQLLSDIFSEVSTLVYTNVGYNQGLIDPKGGEGM